MPRLRLCLFQRGVLEVVSHSEDFKAKDEEERLALLKELNDILWLAASAPLQANFDRIMGRVRELSAAGFDHANLVPTYKWAMHALQVCCFGRIDCNDADSSYSVLAGAKRHMALPALLRQVVVSTHRK